MNTPILDFILEYFGKGTVRAHMPGHKGRAQLGFEFMDITEIEGADELFGAEGVIRESERNAAELFGTQRTLYSAEGSSLCIRAMLYLALVNAKEKARKAALKSTGRYTVLAARNAHFAFLTACAALDLDIEWLLPEDGSLLSCPVGEKAAEDALARLAEEDRLPICLYVTSPDYLGSEQPIAELAHAARLYGVPLAVDNAHGAYLRFLANDRHPISLGADICCDSAHKTLCCLTGAAYLHIARSAPACFAENAKRAMSLFASTSPSYLILASLDAMNARLGGGFGEALSDFAEKLAQLKKRLESRGFPLVGTEELKLTAAPRQYGYSGLELAEKLRESGIEPEYADADFTVLMLSPENGGEDIARIEKALFAIERRPAIAAETPKLPVPERVMTVREAMLSPQETVPIEEAAGRVMALDHCACPPAVPIVTAGERITAEAVKLMRHFGKKECAVVKE